MVTGDVGVGKLGGQLRITQSLLTQLRDDLGCELQSTSSQAKDRRGPRSALGVAGLGVLLEELVDAAGGVHEALLARVEGVANAADLDLQLLDRRARLERVPATAGHGALGVVGMDSLFHGSFAFPCG